MTQNLIHQKNDNTFKIIIGIIVIICTVIIIVFVINKKEQSDISIQSVQQKPSIQKKITAEPEPAPAPSPKPVINYNELEKNEVLKKTMQQRKKKYDIKNSLDLIVSSNEIFMIKNYEISMAEVLKSAALKRGDVVEESIGNDEKNKDIKQYGIYVVKPGDNIWNIHFNILKEYYGLQNVSVDKKVDEPDKMGFSSGVGKILKFSETQVIIYNLEEGTIDTNINIIEPLTKIIIYNMHETFSLLDEINFENVDRLQFDGKTIWISTDT